jgi:anti-sigma factor RsiW
VIVPTIPDGSWRLSNPFSYTDRRRHRSIPKEGLRAFGNNSAVIRVLDATPMTCPDVERLVDAYSDDELDTAEASDVSAHLITCPACHQRAVTLADLRRLIRGVPYHVATERLRRAIATTRRPPRVTTQWLALAATALLAVSLGTNSVVRMVQPRQAAAATASLAQDVVAGHVRALMGARLFDVRSTDQHTVKPWFLGRLDFSPPVEDLAPLGFPLVGGRLDEVAGRPVAALVYQRRLHTINVFIWPAADTAGTLTDARSLRGFQVRHWTHDAMAFWAVSDLNDFELDQFVRTLHQ